MFSRYQSNKEVVLPFVGMRTTTTIAFNCFIGVFLTVTVTGEHEFASEAKIHDERHIKEHLKNKINVSKMTEEQQRFHYFMMSDLDKDGRIDDTEIIQALSHVHNSSGDTVNAVGNEETLISLVDGVLRNMDMNGDGYIDYAEYNMYTKESHKNRKNQNVWRINKL